MVRRAPQGLRMRVVTNLNPGNPYLGRMRFPFLLWVFCCMWSFVSTAQSLIQLPVKYGFTEAQWITHPTASLQDYGVYHFRKDIELEEIPGPYLIHLSADNRFRLYVNGQLVTTGPGRSDLQHWPYVTIDLQKYLHKGINQIAAEVWNFGTYKAASQISRATAFFIQGQDEKSAVMNTNQTWKVLRNAAYTVLPVQLPTYFVADPGEAVNGLAYPWGWQTGALSAPTWLNAKTLGPGRLKGYGTTGFWDFVPSELPLPELSLKRFESVRRSQPEVSTRDWLQGKKPLTVPAHSTLTLLVDAGKLMTGYPMLRVSEGMDAQIEVVYAEALLEKDGTKGHRMDITGKTIVGVTDQYTVPGIADAVFQPLTMRTFHYVELRIRTSASPLVLEDYTYLFTAYPFEQRASFECSDARINELWKMSWHTLRLCSHDTHMDCPYYEQLQYGGDTRIQNLIALYVSGDDRLMRQALRAFDRSRLPEGITQSRYPSHDLQVIPPFSLFWVNMVHDYWMHMRDSAFVRSMMPGVKAVLDWYQEKLDPATGVLGPVPYWNFVDWTDAWPWVHHEGGVPDGGRSGGSSIISLQYAYALRHAGALLDYFGEDRQALQCRDLSVRVGTAVMQQCYDASRQWLRDAPGGLRYSEHAQIIAVLAGAPLPGTPQEWMQRLLKDRTLIPCSYYYRFYFHQALQQSGLEKLPIWSWYGPWNEMLNLGLSTCSEKPEPTRSDCHAWSASPAYDLLATTAGIRPGSHGFQSIQVRPQPGGLDWLQCSMPHPDGMIHLQMKKDAQGNYHGSLKVPVGVPVALEWNGSTLKTVSGEINF